MENPVSSLNQYDVVRVTRTSDRADADAWGVNQRPPKVGDIGTVIEILSDKRANKLYIVECVASSGHTIWLTEFKENEIEKTECNA